MNAKVQGDVAQKTHDNAKEIETLKQQTILGKVQADVQIEGMKGAQAMKEIYIQSFLDGKLNIDSIRVKGDEDAQLAILKGEIQKDIERIKSKKLKSA